MARPQKRKIQQVDDLLSNQPLTKKPKSNGTAAGSWNHPPEFYDNLSKVWLTPLALRELDRRNNLEPLPEPVIPQAPSEDIASVVRKGSRELARFAKLGGPDLSDIRGYQGPRQAIPTMASPSVPFSSNPQAQSTKQTTLCEEHHIYPPFYKFPDGRRPPEPANLDEIKQALREPRRSLSPSIASETAFEDFQVKNTAISDRMVKRDIIPLLAGNDDILNEGQLPFTNLASITNNTTVDPNPDFFDGAHPDALDREVKEALDRTIIPTGDDTPIAPNLFLEAKCSNRSMDVVEGQVILDGAYGVTAMHALQNYLIEEPIYDGNAYTFSAAFVGGCLNLYAHYPIAPAKLGQNFSYHITLLNGYALAGNYEAWLAGIGAFRNLRKLAEKYRDQFIEAANMRSRGQSTEVAVVEETPTTEKKQDGGSSPVNF